MSEQGGHERPPVPDPTILTTAALQREVAIIERRIAELQRTTEHGILEVKSGCAEKLNAHMVSARELTNLQFELMSTWRLEQKDDTKVRLDAAFAAQKEAITKQEASTDKQLEQLRLTFTTAFDELRRSMEEVKGRVGAIEATKLGSQEQRIETRQMTAATMGLIIGAITIFMALVSIIGIVIANQP